MINGYRICRGSILFYLRDPLKTFGRIWGKTSSDQEEIKGHTLPNINKKNRKRIGKGKICPKNTRQLNQSM